MSPCLLITVISTLSVTWLTVCGIDFLSLNLGPIIEIPILKVRHSNHCNENVYTIPVRAAYGAFLWFSTLSELKLLAVILGLISCMIYVTIWHCMATMSLSLIYVLPLSLFSCIHYPTLGCDIQGFWAMGLSVQYWPRWFQDFPAISLAVPFGANGAHLGICTLP